jgi:putative copper export protein/mono/diheme cytochrome c family protein
VTEFVSVLSRLAGYLSLAWLIGGAAFLLLSGPTADPILRAWRERGSKSFLWAVSICFLATFTGLVAQTAVTVDLPFARMIDEGEWLKSFAFQTRYGRVALLKLSLLLILLVSAHLLVKAKLPRSESLGTALVLILAMAVAATGPLASHAAGDELAAWLQPFQIMHAVAASAWIGGLPAWIGLVLAVGPFADVERCAYAAAALNRFSRLATICVVVIVASGVALGAGFVNSQGDLLGTSYGLLICSKVTVLLGILLIANHLRQAFLPAVTTLSGAPLRYAAAARWVSLELSLATIVLGLASMLSQTMPAAHQQPYWWLPFRFTLDATWPVWPTPLLVVSGAVLTALSAVWLLSSRPGMAAPQRAAVVAAGLVGMGFALWPLTVPAYPDTYRRSTVPYLTVSIFEGKKQFERQCTACHGPGGLGDGPAAKELPKQPANLSEPHTALHTAGDMFWWLEHGIQPSGMPGFAHVLSDEDRWDVINFLRAFSQGFQARVLTPSIVSERPWLGAPDFYLDGNDDKARELKDFREKSNVLLVFPDPDQQFSLARLRELGRDLDRMRADGLVVLVISDILDAGVSGSATIVRGAANEIRESYELLSRTLLNRGDGRSLGMKRSHMEFLIDRFGYIRARWIADEEPNGWSPTDRLLLQQVDKLNTEPRMLPPPDNHIH